MIVCVFTKVKSLTHLEYFPFARTLSRTLSWLLCSLHSALSSYCYQKPYGHRRNGALGT